MNRIPNYSTGIVVIRMYTPGYRAILNNSTTVTCDTASIHFRRNIHFIQYKILNDSIIIYNSKKADIVFIWHIDIYTCNPMIIAIQSPLERNISSSYRNPSFTGIIEVSTVGVIVIRKNNIVHQNVLTRHIQTDIVKIVLRVNGGVAFRNF